MTHRLKRFIFYWLPVIAYCLAIYIQSGMPSIKHIPTFEFSDKILHFMAYAVMGVLFYRAYLTLRIKNDPRMLILISIISASLYGVSDEIHQYFVPFRDASVGDTITDTLGAICGVYLYHIWVASRARSQRTEDRCQGLDDQKQKV